MFYHFYPFYSTSEILTLLYTCTLKMAPFRAEPSRLGDYREYPHPPLSYYPWLRNSKTLALNYISSKDIVVMRPLQ